MAFDINRLLSTTFEDSFATTSTPCPEGEYLARIDKIEVRSITIRATQEERGILRLKWVPEDPDGRIKQVTGRDKVLVDQDLWLDMTPEGNLDSGPSMNVQLGRLRELFGQNKKGQPWGFSMLTGNMARVLVTHRSDDKGGVFAEVKSFTAI